jgi:phosphoglycerate dehydrogenase-like enzyme
MTLRVHLLDSPEDNALAVLHAHLDADVSLTFGREPASPANFHILVAGRPERAHLSLSPELRQLVIPFAGIPPTTCAMMRDFNHIAVHNLHHNAALTAEMAMALLLSAAKFIIPYDRALRAHDWTPRYRPNLSLRLEGQTALVLGFGAIGTRVARACWGLGMQVLGIRRKPQAEIPGFPVEIYPPQALDDLLARARVLVITLPATPATNSLIGARELALMPRGGLLVNIGRASIVVEQALFEALECGQLAAAGMDVWYNYPSDQASRANTPPANLPFHQLENVVMSPHRAGHAEDTETLRMTALADLLNKAAHGQPIPNRVDLDAGY